MGFKTAKSYNEDRFANMFRLVNDGDKAEVVFLYRSEEDVLVADVHYIKSAEYSGYVHCCGKGCPACAKKIRTQTKLFIPLFNMATREIEFFDRSMRFEPQLQSDVFAKFPNPSEYVFCITRSGVPNSVDTTYSIKAIGRNSAYPFDDILKIKGTSYPECYEMICKDMPASELLRVLDTNSTEDAPELPSYQVTPRAPTGAVAPPASSVPDLPDFPEEVSTEVETDSDEELGDPVF